MIRLNVFIQVEKSCRDKVLDIARKLTECSLKEVSGKGAGLCSI